MPEHHANLAALLFDAAKAMTQFPKGRNRCEDLISATAAFAGEVCMRKAAAFDFDNHTFTPGKRIFSDKVNAVLSGDKIDWNDIPVDSAFGELRAFLTGRPDIQWPAETFPLVAEVYKVFAKGAPRLEWGYVPLSAPPANAPHMPPLRCAFELRRIALSVISPHSINLLRTFSAVALTKALVVTRQAIDPAIAIRLAMETMNGIAKTAPILPQHIQEFARESATPH